MAKTKILPEKWYTKQETCECQFTIKVKVPFIYDYENKMSWATPIMISCPRCNTDILVVYSSQY